MIPTEPVRQSTLSTSQHIRKKVDPNELDFAQLRKNYMETSSTKVPFVRSSFVHYCKNDFVYEEGGMGGDDTIITMELINAPKNLNYTTLQDPAEVRKKKMAQRKEEEKAAMQEKRAQIKADKKAARRAELEHAKEQKQADRAALKAEKLERVREKEDLKAQRAREREEKIRLAREHRQKHGINSDEDEEENEFSEENEDEFYESQDEDEQTGDEEQDEEDEDEGYGDEESGESENDSYGNDDYDDEDHSEEQSGNGDEDREYSGNMFENKPIDYALLDMAVQGEENHELKTFDYTNISIWRIGGELQRYSRLRDVVISLPPIKTDQRFYVSHSGNAVYFLGTRTKGQVIKQKLVVVMLRNLKVKEYDISKLGNKLTSLDGSSLIANNRVLVFETPVPQVGKKKATTAHSNKWMCWDLLAKKERWVLNDVERIFFKKEEAQEEGEEEEQNQEGEEGKISKKDADAGEKTDNEAGDPSYPDETFVLVTSYEKHEVLPEGHGHGEGHNHKEKEGDKKEEAAKKFQDVKFWRVFVSEWGNKHFQKGEVKWETFIEKAAPVKVVEEEVKKPEEEKKEPSTLAEKAMAAFAAKTAAALNVLQPEDDEEDDGKGDQVDQLVLETTYASSPEMDSFLVVHHGKNGEQHMIKQFTEDKKEVAKVQSRPGNTEVQLSMNSHVRDGVVFVISITKNGQTTAKPLIPADQQVDKFPVLILDNLDRHMPKDCWINNASSEGAIQSIGKSDSDEYLNCNSISLVGYSEDDPSTIAKLKQSGCKLKSQEVDMNFPCIVSNIGCRVLAVQSVKQPLCHASLELTSDFVAFVQFSDLKEIGFLDKRKLKQRTCNWQEAGDRIAFLTRAHGKCDKKDSCEKGDLLLNILQVDSFSVPMTFQLYQTTYEACMSEGSSDDIMHRAYATQVVSARGVDVALCLQYNDRIVFDCVTSTRQNPICLPIEKHDQDVEWEQLDICKLGKMERVFMQQDTYGALYFIMRYDGGKCTILRQNPDAEMGDVEFITKVFEFRSELLYFFLYNESNNRFYIMDQNKKVRVLIQDPNTFQLSVELQLEFCSEDKKLLVHQAFDEYAITNNCLHWDENVFVLIDSRVKDNPTWYSTNCMLEDHCYVAGPKKADKTNMIFYQMSYEPQEGEDEDSDQQKSSNETGGYSIVVMPMCDAENIDLFPQHAQNHHNFISYIDPVHVLAYFSGRYLVFKDTGKFITEVHFSNKDIQPRKLILRTVSDNMEYFVFEGPPAVSKSDLKERRKSKMVTGETKGSLLADVKAVQKPAAKKGPKKKEEEKKEPTIYHVYKLKAETRFNGETTWEFVEQETTIQPEHDHIDRLKTHYDISSHGMFDKVKMTDVKVEFKGQQQNLILTVVVNSMQSKPKPDSPAGKLSLGATLAKMKEDKALEKEDTFTFTFDAEERHEKQQTLHRRIKNLERKKLTGKKAGHIEEHIKDLHRRMNTLNQAWCFGPYLVAKCGNQLQYIRRGGKKKAVSFNIDVGADVWIQNIYTTGCEDLLQLFVVHDEHKQVYVITWNLALNREHSLYESPFAEGDIPSSLLLKSFGGNQAHNFNVLIRDGALVNLEFNTPCQFYNRDTVGDLVPRNLIPETCPGQKRVSEDKLKYFDLQSPGRCHHFISFLDLLYWERYQIMKEKHELSRNRITTFEPFARFPKGISILHTYATNVKLLSAFRDALVVLQNDKPESARALLLPLLVLHRSPHANKTGRRLTPMHVALEKQSPVSFETMLQLVAYQTRTCLTGALLDRFDDIINSASPVVNEFLSNSFFITSQFDGPRPLQWSEDSTEKFVAVPTSFLTSDFLQSLVNAGGDDEEEGERHEGDDFKAAETSNNNFGEHGLLKYSVEAIEQLTSHHQENNLKQVEAKILDFDWVFSGDNASKFLNVLGNTDNDEVFACAQIRVFINFMWQDYYQAIMRSLFIPFLLYFTSFVAYSTYFVHSEDSGLSWNFIVMLVCLVVFGKTFITFLILEIIQFRDDPRGYFTNFWNLLDFTSLVVCAGYVTCSLMGSINDNSLNILGSFACLLLWAKLFYWMRLFKPFSAFIRIITEIMKDIQIFTFMLFLCLSAFANVIIVLQINRDNEGADPIFDAFTGILPIDALLHAYLTGLGDFGKDNYSSADAKTMWLMFFIATILVQLVFMNMLIAIMGESFGRITAMQEQSTLKEVCTMMNDHIWLLKISELYKDRRYILWLTPDTAKTGGTAVERSISQLREYVEERSDQTESKMLRQIAMLDEKVTSIVNSLEEKAEESDGY